MICHVKDGRYHGRRVCAAFIGSVLTQTSNPKQRTFFFWGAHAPSRVGFGTLAETIFRKVRDDEGVIASTRDACATQKNALNCRVFLTHLECTSCGLRHAWQHLQNLCTSCHKPLFAIYDLDAAGHSLKREALATREKSLWRYREVLPLPDGVEPISLGEGGTPLLGAERFGRAVELSELWVKDESQNPTQSFKARGMAVAVSMAKYLGATKLAVPSAGNAGGALAAYAARAGLEAHVFMPRDTPRANIIECRELGAQVTLIDGLITDCGAEIAKRKRAEGWFDMSTLKEPYRLEGKKTLGYELAEQSDWQLPDVILYPTGGGTGLIGMWKAFDEMEVLGWIGKNGRECSPSRPPVAHRSSARFKSEKKLPRNFQTRIRLLPVCAFRKPSAIFLS
jgi:hypothetical protein